MNWSDEHYVKLFTRDTVTWRSWPWQARALFPLLLRAVDGAGMLNVGTRELGRSVALMVDLPVDVVTPGLDALLADGTVEMVGGDLIITNFLDAQESRKTNAQSKHEQREKAKAVARRSQVLGDTTPNRQTAADDGRSGHPPAQPSSAQPSSDTSSRKKPREGKPAKPPDPRHAPLVSKLDEVFKTKRGAPYPFDGRSAKTVQRLLQRRPSSADVLWPIELVGAWARALDSRFPGCSTLEDFERQLPKHIGTGPPDGSAPPPAKPRVYADGPVTIPVRNS